MVVLQAAPRHACVCVRACKPACPRTGSKFCFYPSDTLWYTWKTKWVFRGQSFYFSLYIYIYICHSGQRKHEVKIPTCSHLLIIGSVTSSPGQDIRSNTNNNLMPCGLSWAQPSAILVCKKMNPALSSWQPKETKQKRKERSSVFQMISCALDTQKVKS